jgi:ABC-type nitrate/sulfonate/bicarbonate transport system substrate-binding protein
MSHRTHLTVQTGWYWDAEFIGYFIAQQLGHYEAAGLTVDFLEGGPEVDPERVLLEGGADIAITVRASTLALIDSGADLEILGAQYRTDPLAVLVPADRPVDALSGLRGSRIAVPEVSRNALVHALGRAGVSVDDVHLLPFVGSAEAFATDAADAVVGYVTSLPVDLAREGVGTRALLLAPEGHHGTPQNLIVARRSMVIASPGPFASWLAASAAGWRANAVDPTRFPAEFASTWFAGSHRPVADEVAHNVRQLEFLGSPDDYLALTTPRTIRTSEEHAHA